MSYIQIKKNIDLLNIKELKWSIPDKTGSINLLEEFLLEKKIKFPSEIITNLREIYILRRKGFPIHKTDSKFIEIVVKITGSYPPNWLELYSKSLDMYKDSLNKLFECLKKQLN